MVPSTFLLVILGLVAVGAAVGMLLSRNSVYSALFLVLNFITIAFLYLILGAPFIALVQVTVYAGSIMVLFLFVIMLLGAEKLSAGEPLRGQRLVSLLLGAAFLFEVVLFLLYRSELSAAIPAPAVGSGSPEVIGTALFTQYALPFEITGFLLLVATIGAIVMTRTEKAPAHHLVDGRRRYKPVEETGEAEEHIVTNA